ncbi:SMP-30/gluconolactonase/LRE family protein [Nocardioides sp. BP30]|uniref:SMP-30/gluconolactonase/LRE family protein n=1 Tax=Nocardioides sp. BP30 TaxID=3036374 RepID=UPI0024691FEC|nr:SMP-30/gluconolactonase/LRE family protein [Nocardioides sp. BP30]WGL50326.1 SMP-30/gluconolactonase/LRE family protein [Nocardioides sp. BP30]
MTGLEVVPVPAHGCEDVVVATSGPDEGCVYTGTADGAVWRIRYDGGRVDRIAETGGRPLGIELHPDGRLLVCDSSLGVLLIDPRSGAVERRLAEVDGRPMRFCNNAAVAADGTVWFSDSSTRFGQSQWKDDLVQNTRTGRLLRLEPSGDVRVVLDGLAFANGVALAPDGSFVAVAETGACTVVRQWLTGERAGTRDLLVADLPGHPDNIATGSDGLIWVTIASPVNAALARLQRAPSWLQRGATRVPEWLQPKVEPSCRVQAYDVTGRVVHDLRLPADRYAMVTGVREHDGTVWLGSLEQPAVARVVGLS